MTDDGGQWVCPGYWESIGVQLGPRVTRRKERRLRIRRNKRRRAERLYERQRAALIRVLEWHSERHVAAMSGVEWSVVYVGSATA